MVKKKKKLTVWGVVKKIFIVLACIILIIATIDMILHYVYRHIIK